MADAPRRGIKKLLSPRKKKDSGIVFNPKVEKEHTEDRRRTVAIQEAEVRNLRSKI